MKAPSQPATAGPAGRLDSWKEIAAYFGRTERTVRRWESSLGLPVHRLAHEKRNSVYAYRDELDAWRESRKRDLDSDSHPKLESQPAPPRRYLRLILPVAVVVFGFGSWLLLRVRSEPPRFKSIAVLPFDNLSHDPQQEWFSDGMTETLITELSKVQSLKVISRTSVMQYKIRTKPLTQIGKELGVDAVVEGSALRFGNRVRITAQLIATATDAHLWGRDFDRDLRDALDLQKEVAGNIAQQVGATIRPGKTRPVNPDAMAAYLRGLYQYNRGDLTQAVVLAREAIRLEPEMARAHELLAMGLLLMADYGRFRYATVVPEARASIQRALELDPYHRTPLNWLGWSYFAHEHDLALAEKYMREGLDESEPITAANYAWILARQGRHAEAIRLVDRGLMRDPANALILTELGRRYEDARKYEDAIRSYRKALELSPGDIYPASHLVFALLLAGRESEAFEAHLQVPRGPAFAGIDWRDLYQSGGWPAVRRVIIDRYPKTAKSEFKTWWLVLSGRRAEALDELERIEKGDSSGALLDLQNPILDPMHQEPRFKALAKRVGYPESMWR